MFLPGLVNARAEDARVRCTFDNIQKVRERIWNAKKSFGTV